MKILFWRFRRYPIKRDEQGRSAREHAFALFWEGKRPSQIRGMIPVPDRTLYRYYEDWKKLNHRIPYATIRKWMKRSPEITERAIMLLASNLEMSREEVIMRLQKPWGLLQFMKGKWPNYRLEREQNEIESRLEAAFEFVRLVEFLRTDPQKLKEKLKKLVLESVESIKRDDLSHADQGKEGELDSQSGLAGIASSPLRSQKHLKTLSAATHAVHGNQRNNRHPFEGNGAADNNGSMESDEGLSGSCRD